MGTSRMTITTTDGSQEIREVTGEEAWAILEAAAQRELGISAKDFLGAWEAGKFDDDTERPSVMRVAMLLPFVSA